MPRLVGKQPSSLPAVSVLLSFLVLTGGVVYYFQSNDPQWLEKQWESVFPPDNSQYQRVLPESR